MLSNNFKLVILLVFVSINSSAVSLDEIHISFNDESAKHWQYISDQTMGGVSNGKAILEKEGDMIFARLIGNVSTANNGGFIQLRSTLSFANLIENEISFKGIKIKTRGNGETYHIFIRTSETRSYRDFFSTTFVAGSDWKIIDLPFSLFKHRFSNKALNGNDIRTFGIVAYGRDFISDVSVSEIIFY